MNAPPKAPVRARTRGPVEMVFEAAITLIFMTLFAWFIGLTIEVTGNYTFWKGKGVEHARHLVEQDIGYIAAAPRSLIIDDTRGFATRLAKVVALPFERFRVQEWHDRLQAMDKAPKAKGKQGQNIRNASVTLGTHLSQWVLMGMYVAQDVVLRLSVAIFALPAFVLACLVGVVDGLVRRDLRRWQGGRESSFVYHHAKRWAVWSLTGGFGLYLSWPFGGFNPAYMILVFTVLVAATLSTTVASFKKYV